METLLISVQIALCVLFIQFCYTEGAPLHFIRRAIVMFPEWIKQPICECLPCMTPYYGVLYVLLFHQLSVETIAAIFIASGINTLIDKYGN